MYRSFVVLLLIGRLEAQTGVAQRGSADAVRQRGEKVAERQKKALAEMAGSIAHQQSSVRRQLRNPQFAGFFSLPPVGTIGPGRAAARCDSLPAEQIDDLVQTAAQRTSVEPELIRSVMRQESDFRPCAVSAKGAMGLMQLLPGTAADLGVKDPFEPQANVLGGARLLKQLLDRYRGDLNLTLGAYNAGSGKVDAARGVPAIPETLDYVSRILSRLSAANTARPPHSDPDGPQINWPATALPISAYGWSQPTVGNNPAMPPFP